MCPTNVDFQGQKKKTGRKGNSKKKKKAVCCADLAVCPPSVSVACAACALKIRVPAPSSPSFLRPAYDQTILSTKYTPSLFSLLLLLLCALSLDWALLLGPSSCSSGKKMHTWTHTHTHTTSPSSVRPKGDYHRFPLILIATTTPSRGLHVCRCLSYTALVPSRLCSHPCSGFPASLSTFQ